ncbi:MAG TPA: hypothetical protein VMR21_10495 [Vicinamibacteria bacterium]|nr:hypothetical protein [Vicinamibacteria bacterium]
MNARWWAVALLGAGGVLYAMAAVPMQRQAGVAADEYRRVRDEARDIRSRLARLERRDAAHARASTVLSGAATPGETVRVVRRSVVQSLQGAQVASVRLGVHPARPPFAARVRLTAEGPFDEVVALAGRLSRPETGVVLDRVRLTPRAGGVSLDLQAVTLARGGGPGPPAASPGQ